MAKSGPGRDPENSREDAAMNVSCPNCATVYRVDPAKVPETGVRARCSICSAVFAVRRDGAGTRAVRAAAARSRLLGAGRRRSIHEPGRIPRADAIPGPTSGSAGSARRRRPEPPGVRPAKRSRTATAGSRGAVRSAGRAGSDASPRVRPASGCDTQPTGRTDCRRTGAGGAIPLDRADTPEPVPSRHGISAGKPVPVPGPCPQGAAAGTGADLGHGGLPSGQAAGRPPGR